MNDGLDPTAEMVLQVMGLSDDDFESLVTALNTEAIPTSRRQLEMLIAGAVPDGPDSEDLTAFVLAFASSFYYGEVDEAYALSRMGELHAEQAATSAEAVETKLRLLFRSRAAILVAGAQVGRRKTAGLVERVSLQMDLRPVVHPDGGTPELYSIYHRLQLVVTDDESGDQERTIEVVLNHQDLKKLNLQTGALLQAQVDVQNALREAGATVFLPLREEG